MSIDSSKNAKDLAMLVQRSSLVNLENFGKVKATPSARPCTFGSGETLKAASILLRGKNVKAWFRTYFATPGAYEIVASSYGINPADVTDQNANDFFREYCNLCMGQVKSVFNDNGIRASIGLPQIMAGHPPSADWDMPDSVTLNASWSLNSSASFNCSLRIGFVPPLKIVVAAEQVAAGGAIEFF
jgi:hypothetical protein